MSRLGGPAAQRRLRRAARAAAPTVVAVAGVIWGTAVAAYAQVENEVNWMPYPWLWLIVVIAALVLAAWLYLEIVSEIEPENASVSSPSRASAVGSVRSGTDEATSSGGAPIWPVVVTGESTRPGAPSRRRRWVLWISLWVGLAGVVGLTVGLAVNAVSPKAGVAIGSPSLAVVFLAAAVALIAGVVYFVSWLAHRRAVRDR